MKAITDLCPHLKKVKLTDHDCVDYHYLGLSSSMDWSCFRNVTTTVSESDLLASDELGSLLLSPTANCCQR